MEVIFLLPHNREQHKVHELGMIMRDLQCP